MIISFILLLFGTIIHLIEPSQFPTIFDGVWWAIVSTSTIGYGDYVPKSVLGRTIGILLILIGVGFVSTYFVTLASMAVTKQNSIKRGTAKMNLQDHIIVIGWNERSRELIYKLNELHPEKSILLIDSTLEENPFSGKKQLFFLKGPPYSDEILKKADLKKAKKIIITADPQKNEMDADMQTILNVVAIKGFAPSIDCAAEILTGEQIVNAKRAGANEVIPSNKLSSSIMLQTALTKGITDPLMDFVGMLNGVKIDLLSEHNLAGHTFEAASSALLKKKMILFGVSHEGKTFIGSSPNEMIDTSDQLLIISRNPIINEDIKKPETLL